MQAKKTLRNISGILLLNKELDMSSSQALIKTRNLFKASKAGHTGALDPKASGLLPLCFGEAAKFSRYFLEGDKEYIATAKLGIRTTTQDQEGEIVEQHEIGDAISRLPEVLTKFIGTIVQTPSIYSAIKVNGRPLYKYARAGEKVEIPSRTVNIYHIELLATNCDTFKIKVKCSKGTYIRTLVDDIGLALGCGAFVQALHRTYVQGLPSSPYYTIKELQDLAHKSENYELLDAVLLPVEIALKNLTKLKVPFFIGKKLCSGLTQDLKRLSFNYDPNLENKEALYLECEGIFIGIGNIKDHQLIPQRMMSDPLAKFN